MGVGCVFWSIIQVSPIRVGIIKGPLIVLVRSILRGILGRSRDPYLFLNIVMIIYGIGEAAPLNAVPPPHLLKNMDLLLGSRWWRKTNYVSDAWNKPDFPQALHSSCKPTVPLIFSFKLVFSWIIGNLWIKMWEYNIKYIKVYKWDHTLIQ